MKITLLIVINLAIIYVLVAAPLGLRSFRMARRMSASPDRVLSAIDPFGANAGWSGTIVSVERLPDGQGGEKRGEATLSWPGRDGLPIRRTIALNRFDGGFEERVTEDSSLDQSFWANWSNRVEVTGGAGDTLVSITRTDTYRGAAFLIFRWFAARRELHKLKVWAETGHYKAGGIFEHPVTQLGLAALSILILWPVFGLDRTGFILSLTLTLVVAAHELGHLAAFRIMGHKKVRMIFIPVLGGLAIGGRPYDGRHEIAFVALMGAGFSAFIVPVAILAHNHFAGTGHYGWAAFCGGLAACAAFFNLANLAPMWKFDGGQVLRQITPEGWQRTVAAMLLLMSMLGFGWLAGFPLPMLLVAGVVIALLSVITARSAVKPRHAMKPNTAMETALIAAGLAAIVTIHGSGIIWAMTGFL